MSGVIIMENQRSFRLSDQRARERKVQAMLDHTSSKAQFAAKMRAKQRDLRHRLTGLVCIDMS